MEIIKPESFENALFIYPKMSGGNKIILYNNIKSWNFGKFQIFWRDLWEEKGFLNLGFSKQKIEKLGQKSETGWILENKILDKF